MSVAESALPVSTRFLRSELRLVFGRVRNLAVLTVLAGVPVLIAVAVRLSRPEDTEGPAFLSSITDNGLFVSLTAMTAVLPLFLPLAVAVVSGDAVAGEADLGTLRYLLTVPVRRSRLLVVKYAVVVTFGFAATLLVGLVGAAIGLALFGTGPVTLLSGTTIGTGAASLRILLVGLYIGVCMAALGAIGLFVSTLTQYPVAAMAATAVLAVTSEVLDAVPQLSAIHPYLPSHWWLAYGDLLREPMASVSVGRGLVSAAVYIAVFGTLAWARFGGRDVSS
ncbi:MAG TPA: ABC transporter permease subunit [Mycobacteriales bacterium]|jgi:ABC-2 type transport system permease protein|nr:ABC transporter permease subunit [Mycobacteriales bacterium]